jgi:hypothetical protein
MNSTDTTMLSNGAQFVIVPSGATTGSFGGASSKSTGFARGIAAAGAIAFAGLSQPSPAAALIAFNEPDTSNRGIVVLGRMDVSVPRAAADDAALLEGLASVHVERRFEELPTGFREVPRPPPFISPDLLALDE